MATVSFTVEELAIVANSIGEALQAIDDWEFDTRVGATPAYARELRERLGELVRAATPPQT